MSETIRRGSEGEAVERLQTILDELEYDPGEVDGIFGEQTELAVIDFQGDFGLDQDGVVGPATWRAMEDPDAVALGDPDAGFTDYRDYDSGLTHAEDFGLDAGEGEVYESLAGQVYRRGSRGGEVHYLQMILELMGYDPGEPDGVFGEQTEVAVIEFQSDVDIAMDGVVGPDTIEALQEALDRLHAEQREELGFGFDDDVDYEDAEDYG